MDFNRIYGEFINYYKDTQLGESEYYSWLRDMRLDESQFYGQARESFKWAKDMLSLLREDKDNKYYKILVGFPLESMNGNIYKERDLIAGALSLKGTHPSLNHKNEFWFSPDNPRNRWGTLTVVDAKYEDGAVEAILQVPKTAICPICNGDKMTSLIDEKKILNVSLEGDCRGGCVDGRCEGFHFTDPPFTLLTTEVVLPGIPLARIKPLESIMIEALHKSSIKNGDKNRMTKIRIKAKVTEDKDNHNISQPNTTVNTNSRVDDARGTNPNPIKTDANIDEQGDVAKTSVGTPAAADNHIMQSGGAYANSIQRQVNREEMPPDGVPASTQGPTNDTSTDKPEDIQTGPPKNKVPSLNSEVPSEAPNTWPATEKPDIEAGTNPPDADYKVQTGSTPAVEAEECEDGYHKDETGACVPDEPASEQVKRIKAETKQYAAERQTKSLTENIKVIETVWANKYTGLDKQYRNALAFNKMQENLIKQQKVELRNEQLRTEDIRVELRDYKHRYADTTVTSSKYLRMVEELKIENEGLKQKYHGSLQNCLKLSKDVTKANEDYLMLATQKEAVEEKLVKARINAKKTLKLKI